MAHGTAPRGCAQHVPDTQCVCLADSEADIYELFSEPRGEVPIHWLVRACQNRSIQPPEISMSACEDIATTAGEPDIVQHFVNKWRATSAVHE